MIDIHTHILPGIDDGSNNLEQSIAQIKMMHSEGVTDIICTPHYITKFYENDREIVDNMIGKLTAEIEKLGLKINLHPGSEVLLNSKSVEDIQTKKLNISEGSYVLVESEMGAFAADFYEILYYLVKSGFKPILAHPERYAEIKKHPNLAEELIHRNVYLQINAGSLMGQYGPESKNTAWHLIENGWAHFLASDNHCRSKEYNLPTAVELTRRNIDDYTAKLLTEINPSKILSNEKIDFFYVSEVSKTARVTVWQKFKEFIGI